MKEKGWSRRQFLHRASAGLAVVGVAGRRASAFTHPHPGLAGGPPTTAALSPSEPAARGLADVKTLKSYRVWDGHCHLIDFDGSTPAGRMAEMLRFADRMGVEKMCVFLGMTFTYHIGAAAMRQQNNDVLDGVSHSKGRALGYAFMDPYYEQACLDEINRCVRDGPMVGLKFEYDTPRHTDSPEMDRIFERVGELQAVVLHHSKFQNPPEDIGESNPTELAAIARRHSSVSIICGHTGGNWELGIRAIRDVPNVYADLCGSDPAAGYTEMAVRELGAERVMYGSDVGGRSFASQLAKVIDADIPDSARHLILGENLRRVLRPILKSKGMQI